MRYGSAVGEAYGHLTLMEVLPEERMHRRIVGRFKCDCGGEIKYPISRVQTGYKEHCGCRTEYGRRPTHGMRSSPEYGAWVQMKDRCCNPNSKSWDEWGGRGICVHPEWVDSFEAFYEHIGPRPDGCSLDRIDTDGHYEPGNVRWATWEQQAQNRRDTWVVEINGRRFLSVERAARAHEVSATTVVRWCDGYVDARRSMKRVPPKDGCRRWRKYA